MAVSARSPLSYAKSALARPYWRSYPAYGAVAFLGAIFLSEWKDVGGWIPFYNRRYTNIDYWYKSVDDWNDGYKKL